MTTAPSTPPASPRRLNLGCGHDIKAGWVNLDSAALPGVDVVWDIEKLPWPFQDGEFDQIESRNTLEHVDYIPILREANRVLKPGGTILLEVPHFTSRDNWIDPTHKKSFSVRTFEFFVRGSRFGRDYYFDFAFGKVLSQKLTFEKGWLPYNHLVEPLVNLHPKLGVLYEATVLRALFPAKTVVVELRK